MQRRRWNYELRRWTRLTYEGWPWNNGRRADRHFGDHSTRRMVPQSETLIRTSGIVISCGVKWAAPIKHRHIAVLDATIPDVYVNKPTEMSRYILRNDGEVYCFAMRSK